MLHAVPEDAAAGANVAAALVVKPPSAAVSALKKGTKESATFKLTAGNSNGNGLAKATIARLRK